jgi:hypothetical protein
MNVEKYLKNAYQDAICVDPGDLYFLSEDCQSPEEILLEKERFTGGIHTFSGWWAHIEQHVKFTDGKPATSVWTLRRLCMQYGHRFCLPILPDEALPLPPGIYHRGYRQTARAEGVGPRTFVGSKWVGDDMWGIPGKNKAFSCNSYGR